MHNIPFQVYSYVIGSFQVYCNVIGLLLILSVNVYKDTLKVREKKVENGGGHLTGLHRIFQGFKRPKTIYQTIPVQMRVE